MFAGCGEDEVRPIDPLPAPAVEDEPIAEPAEVPEPSEVQRQMHDRYDAVGAIRQAFVRGDLEVAKAVARSIGPVSGELPAAAAPLRGSVPERARDLVSAADLTGAARAFGGLLEACGRCHDAAGATWSFETPPTPEGDSPEAHMGRHQWAIERMWEGLLVADAGRFDMGATALAEAPLGRGSAVEPLAARVHVRAAGAARAESLSERAMIFGDVLATCAQCHRHFESLEAAGVQ